MDRAFIRSRWTSWISTTQPVKAPTPASKKISTPASKVLSFWRTKNIPSALCATTACGFGLAGNWWSMRTYPMRVIPRPGLPGAMTRLKRAGSTGALPQQPANTKWWLNSLRREARRTCTCSCLIWPIRSQAQHGTPSFGIMIRLAGRMICQPCQMALVSGQLRVTSLISSMTTGKAPIQAWMRISTHASRRLSTLKTRRTRSRSCATTACACGSVGSLLSMRMSPMLAIQPHGWIGVQIPFGKTGSNANSPPRPLALKKSWLNGSKPPGERTSTSNSSNRLTLTRGIVAGRYPMKRTTAPLQHGLTAQAGTTTPVRTASWPCAERLI